MSAHALKAAGRGRVGLAAMAAVLVLASATAAPAQEPVQEKTPATGAVDADAFVTEAYELCRDVAWGDGAVVDDLDAAGWTYEIDPYGEQPYYQDLEGRKTFAGLGEADMWAFLEFYPTYTLGYCHVEIFSPEGTVSFDALDRRAELSGGTEVLAETIYGSWEETGQPVYVRADTDARIYIQVTVLTPE